MAELFDVCEQRLHFVRSSLDYLSIKDGNARGKKRTFCCASALSRAFSRDAFSASHSGGGTTAEEPADATHVAFSAIKASSSCLSAA